MFKEEYADLKISNTPEMIALSEACARRMGMEPYYLYRQKNMAGNFENVGYSSGKGMSVQYFDHGGVSNDRRLRRRNYHKSGVPV